MTKILFKCHLKCPHKETFVYLPKKKIKKFKFEKAQFTNNGAIQLYIAREGSESGGKLSDPDPAKRSGSDWIRNPDIFYLFRMDLEILFIIRE